MLFHPRHCGQTRIRACPFVPGLRTKLPCGKTGNGQLRQIMNKFTMIANACYYNQGGG